MSYRRGHKFLTVVVDHDTGRLVWTSPGKSLEGFLDALGPERRARIRLVSADAAGWIGPVVARSLPNAALCLDPFHVVRVRHEAPCVRGRVRDPPLRAVAAAR